MGREPTGTWSFGVERICRKEREVSYQDEGAAFAKVREAQGYLGVVKV